MLRDVLKLGMLLETEAYRRGRAGFEAGRTLADNPYTEAAWRTDWDLGWRHARRVKTANENRPVAGGDAYAAGQAAAAEGRAATENPYLPGHPGFERWRLGWAARRAS
jgi:ribosome modulation factor